MFSVSSWCVGLASLVAVLPFDASAHAIDHGGTNQTLPVKVEAYRLDQVAMVRTHRDAVETCLASASRGRALSPSASVNIADDIYEQCSPALLHYAISLLALAPSPDYAQAATLVRNWKPTYIEQIMQRIDGARSAAGVNRVVQETAL